MNPFGFIITAIKESTLMAKDTYKTIRKLMKGH